MVHRGSPRAWSTQEQRRDELRFGALMNQLNIRSAVAVGGWGGSTWHQGWVMEKWLANGWLMGEEWLVHDRLMVGDVFAFEPTGS